LARDDRTSLVEHIAGGKRLPQEVIRQIVDRADVYLGVDQKRIGKRAIARDDRSLRA
jgi:hypothetical protein